MKLHLALAAASLTSCGAPRRATAPGDARAASTGQARSATPAAPPPSISRRVVAQREGAWVECSNAGGTHLSFAYDGGRHAHAGGHARYFFGSSLAPSFGRPAAPSAWYAAAIYEAPRLDEDHDGEPDSSRAGWCLDTMPASSGEVVALWAATDRADAERQLVLAGATSAALTATASTARIGVARVRAVVDTWVPRRTQLTLDALAGDPPATIDLPDPTRPALRPFAGDLLVVASTADGVPTRMVTARDRAEADARAAALTDGWPEVGAPIYGTVAPLDPEVLIGEVAAGGACGDDVLLGPGRDPRAPLRRAAAPPGTRPADRVTVLVEPIPPDPCGRQLAVVRAWLTPGATGVAWRIAGPPPGPPLVE